MAKQTAPPGTISLRFPETVWIGNNRRWLEEEHAGHWIAVKGSELIAAGPDLSKVMEEARAKGADHPLLATIPKKEYQGLLRAGSPRIRR